MPSLRKKSPMDEQEERLAAMEAGYTSADGATMPASDSSDSEQSKGLRGGSLKPDGYGDFLLAAKHASARVGNRKPVSLQEAAGLEPMWPFEDQGGYVHPQGWKSDPELDVALVAPWDDLLKWVSPEDEAYLTGLLEDYHYWKRTQGDLTGMADDFETPEQSDAEWRYRGRGGRGASSKLEEFGGVRVRRDSPRGE